MQIKDLPYFIGGCLLVWLAGLGSNEFQPYLPPVLYAAMKGWYIVCCCYVGRWVYYASPTGRANVAILAEMRDPRDRLRERNERWRQELLRKECDDA